MKRGRKWGLLALCLAIPLGVGWLSSWITGDSMEMWSQLIRPPFSPPGPAFPVVWTVLFLIMGLASFWVVTESGPQKLVNRALKWYAIQLIFNFFWPIWFFRLGQIGFALIWLLILWVLVLLTVRAFWAADPKSGWLLGPYLLWVTFAAYLNFGVWILN